MMETHEYRNNTEYQKAIQFLKKGCKCGCSHKLPHEKFARLRAQFKSLSKPARDSFVMGQLLAMKKGEMTISSRFPKRQRINIRVSYRWNNETPVCQITYLNMLGVSRDYLEPLIFDAYHLFISERIHGNTGRPPQWKTKTNINQETKETIKNFILNYAETHGLPDPGKSKNKKHSIIFLPTDMTYKSVYRDFLASLEENNNLKSLKYEAFRRLWHQLTPQIKFMNPRTDLCDTCHRFRNELHACQDEKTKVQLKKKVESIKNKPN